jgi:type IV secretory pathway VirB2 component (pilin)
MLMPLNRIRKAGTSIASLAAIVAVSTAWAGNRPFVTPGTHQIFRMDSIPGALLEFLIVVALVIAGIATLARARHAWLLFAGLTLGYAGALLVSSLVTPEKIVSIGDAYCWDLWCVGLSNVHKTPQGENTTYIVEVSLFPDSTTEQLELKSQSNQFLYAVDDRGRRFPVVVATRPGYSPIVVKPGQTAKASLTFIAPSDVHNLYLTGDVDAPLWVRLYFGSDLNPLHRRTLLRVA